MAQITFRANLSSSLFPLLSENQGRTVLIKQYDQNYVPTVASKDDADKDIGIPQLYYAHNVMPFSAGYNSIGYRPRVLPIDPTETKFFQVLPIRNTNMGVAAFVGVCSDGRFFVSYAPYGNWTYITTLANSGGKRITYAQVEGETYIYVYKSGCYKFNFSTQVFDSVTLQGLDASTIIGITASGGYLIALSDIAVYWSSTVDITDFQPSTITGAGGGQLQEAKGTLVTAVATLSGFVVYTTANIVVAIASGNVRYPFNFRSLAGSGGLADAELVTIGENIASQYAYTSVGLTSVSPVEAKVVLPDVTDFISGKIFEDFNEITNNLELTNLAEDTQMVKRIALISARFLVISYGITEFTHALVFDVAQKRLGKLKINHVDCFEFSLISNLTTDTPKDSIGFALKDGTIKTVEFSPAYADPVGVMITGKYQVHRSRLTQLNEVHLENIRPGMTFSLTALVAIDGKTISSKKPGYLAISSEFYRKYTFRAIGTNISLLFKGGFSISSLVLNVNLDGSR